MRFCFSVLVQKIIVFESTWLTKSYLQKLIFKKLMSFNVQCVRYNEVTRSTERLCRLVQCLVLSLIGELQSSQGREKAPRRCFYRLFC